MNYDKAVKFMQLKELKEFQNKVRNVDDAFDSRALIKDPSQLPLQKRLRDLSRVLH